MRLVVATRSAHKLGELRRLLPQGLRLKLELISLTQLEEEGISVPEIVEDAPDFAGNAEKKARTIAASFDGFVLADDSGLCVDALDGEPGVLSARFSGVEGEGRDAANNQALLARLQGVSEPDRGASFVCALCLIGPSGQCWQIEGRCFGRIGEAEQGAGGFGYDPLFLSLEPGQTGLRSHGELSPVEKDAISHRGYALRALVPLLERLLAEGRFD